MRGHRDPLEDALQAVRNAQEAMVRAQNYHEFLKEGSTIPTELKQMADALVEMQVRLIAMVNP